MVEFSSGSAMQGLHCLAKLVNYNKGRQVASGSKPTQAEILF